MTRPGFQPVVTPRCIACNGPMTLAHVEQIGVERQYRYERGTFSCQQCEKQQTYTMGVSHSEKKLAST